jgi:molecular chaperone HtpG
MDNSLPSKAERNAAQAQEFRSFSKFNLVGAREDLKQFLSEIGRNGIFSEYTRHDISHIDTLLGMLDWIVVPETAAVMTPIDWMLIVLSIYFHDAGLVVNKAEFEKRNSSGFPEFRDGILSSPKSTSYKERVNSLDCDERERFLYQEFVRIH